MSGPGNLTTSNVVDYDPPGTDVITAAFRRMGTIDETEVPTAGMFRDGLSTLNSMMKELETTGIHIWTVEEAILFFRQFQFRYLLSKTSADHCADAYSYSLSQLNLTAIAGATAINLVRPGNFFAKGNQIGINLDSGDAFWTTVPSDPTGLAVPLAAPLPSSASQQNFVYAYKENIDRPLRIPAARRIAYGTPPSGSILTPLTNMMSRQAYMDLPQPETPGQVTQAYYNPARNIGELFVWNAPQNTQSGLRFTYYRPIQVFTSVDDLADLPQEWGNALKWSLAKELGPQYSIPAERWDRILMQAGQKAELAMGWDREPESIYFGRGYDQTSRSGR